MEFKNFDDKQRVISKADKRQMQEQMQSLIATHAIKEINETLNFCMISSLMTCMSLLDPEIIKALEERFKTSIETLKISQDTLSISKDENLKKVIDVPATIDKCAEPYLGIIEAIKKAILDVRK